MSYYSKDVDALSKDLSEICVEKRAEPVEQPQGPSGLELIASGQTCCRSVDATIKAAAHCADEDIKRSELGKKLKEHVKEKQAAVLSFLEEEE